MRKLNVLIAGSTGYIGVQLVKLLSKHQNINIKYLCGNNSVGKNISFFDNTLENKKLPKIVKFNKTYLKNVDIIFTALPNGEAQEISKHLLVNNRLIDLAADFRLEDPKEYKKWYKINHKSVKNISNSIYAIPEISKKYLKNYKIIGCPGCYPTSILLPLLPLLKKNLISHKNIIIDSKSGYSGAGRGIHKRNERKNLYESLSAYGVGKHRHSSEIHQEMAKEEAKKLVQIIPEMGNAEERPNLVRSIRDYGFEQGFTKEEIEGLIDSRSVNVLMKAMKYDNMQKADVKSKKVKNKPKMAKSGTKKNPKTDANRRRNAEMSNQLKSSGKVADAAKMMEEFF